MASDYIGAGVCIRHLPITAEKVYRALKDNIGS